MNETLHITSLGNFCLSYGDITLSSRASRAKKVWRFLACLFTYRGRFLSAEQLLDLLWGEEEIADPANTLRILHHRLRTLLKKAGIQEDLILLKQGSYTWNNQIAVHIDTDTFEALIREAAVSTDENAAQLLDTAISLYDGDYLAEFSSELWVAPISLYYHNLYLKAVYHRVSLLQKEKSYENIIHLCRHALTLDWYDEDLHLSLTQALADSGAITHALEHYHKTSNLYQNTFGASLSAPFQQLYQNILRESHNVETSLSQIQQTLDAEDLEEGALYCDYLVFRHIYHLERRTTKRTGVSVPLCLITAKDPNGNDLTERNLKKVMNHMQETIRTAIRSGDVFCDYSKSQFLLLLPGSNTTQAEAVLRRIIEVYHKKYLLPSVRFQYSILPSDRQPTHEKPVSQE